MHSRSGAGFHWLLSLGDLRVLLVSDQGRNSPTGWNPDLGRDEMLARVAI